jgi:hypothetical protein
VRRVFRVWLVLLPCVLDAQTPASVRRAVNSITPGDVHRRIAILADDSMRGRDTPSPELEKAAAYIAGEFKRVGLKPGGDSGSYLQRYGMLERQFDTAGSALVIAGRVTVTLTPGVDVNVLPLAPLPTRAIAGPVVILAGPPDSAKPLAGADVHGAWVALIATATPQGVPLDGATAQAALQSGAIGVLIVSNRPDAQWQNRLARLAIPSVTPEWRAAEGAEGAEGAGGAGGDTPRQVGLVEIRDATAAGALGIDPAALRSQQTRSARRLEGITLTFRARQRTLERVSAPNVVGILEGSDPKLKHEYVFLTGHMDHVGVAGPGNPACRAVGADSICNGADDDASGTTAVIEAAEAFSQLTPRPRRSVVFMTVSGEEKGLWGSEYFAEHPAVPLGDIVADLNTDMVGRNWKDTIAVIGKEHSDLGRTLNRIATAHPELRMTPIDDIWPQENFYFRSDHYNFARKGVPILFFFSGTHADYHQVSDEVAKIDAEKESRIIKLVFYLGLDIANAAERPRWNPESYRRIVEAAGK